MVMRVFRVSLTAVVCGLVMRVAGQPTGCVTNDQCPVDHFCASTGYCRECLRCEDLKRHPPSTPTSCIMSVVKCGDCFPGLVEDPSGDVSATCVPPGGGGGGGAGGAPAYLWAALAAGLLLLVLLAALVVYVLRNTDTLKILASTRASVQSPSNGVATGAPLAADYRAPPPPYNYQPVRPTSPPLPDDHAPTPPATLIEEPCAPFIKRSAPQGERAARAARERDAAQEARVYNQPHYVRGPHLPHLPPSYESATSGEESGPELHDENTMESTWSPAPPAPAPAPAPALGPAPAPRDANRSSVGGAPNELSTLVANVRAAAAATDEQPTPSKMLCLRQDSNNNSSSSRSGSGGGGEGASGSSPAPPAPPAPALTFNITVQQHNDLKLIRT